MKNVQYISSEYVPRVNLEVLGNSYNTLEQGHQAAVKAFSDLEIAVANLDMDADEDGFKQLLINEINDVVDKNTLYGNSFGALDDLVKKVGDIQSDGRVIGRLRNNKAKKEYDAKVDSMNIPDGMKEMYKELNPYYYEDGEIDNNTGKTLPGELWKPKNQPVTTVPEADIQLYALKIASTEAGSGEIISFLDSNMKETYDPTKSFDGNFYRKVGKQYERLSEDKIREAYRVAIESIPGAKDSLHQDYMYNKWQYEKLIKDAAKKGGNTVPYIEGFTDRNGNIYTEEQWLNNKINNFVSVSAYNHVYSNITMGSALQTMKSLQLQRQALNGSDGDSTKPNSNNILGNAVAGLEETETNTFVNSLNAKEAANQQGLSLIKPLNTDWQNVNSISDVIQDLMSKNLATGPGSAANYIIQQYGKNLSSTEKNKIIHSFMGYYQANKQYSDLIKAAGKDGEPLIFSANVFNREYTPDNEYGRKIIEQLNKFYTLNNVAYFQVGKQVMNNVLSRYKTDINGLRQLGMRVNTTDDGNYFVIISSQHRNLLPEFAFNIREANKEVPGTVGGWLKNKFTTKVDKTNYHGYGFMGTMNDLGMEKDPYIELANLYSDGLDSASKAEEKIGISKGTRSYNIGSYESFGAAFAALYPHLIPANETAAQYVDRQNKQVDNMFANGMFSAGNISFEDETGYAYKDLSKNIDAKNLIQSMYSDSNYRNKVTRSIKVPSGSEAGNNQGYKLVFIVPEGLGNDSFKEGEKVSMIVSGTTAEESNFNPALNPDVIATNAVTISKSTQGNVDIMGYNNELGLTDLLYNKSDDTYKIGFGGIDRNIDESEAIEYTTAMYALQYLKSEVYAGLYDIYSQIGQELLNNKINNIAIPISNVTNKDVNEVKRIILNYLSTQED